MKLSNSVKNHRALAIALMVTTSLIVNSPTCASQAYDNYDDYQDGGADYYSQDNYYAQEEDTLYQDHMERKQNKGMDGGAGGGLVKSIGFGVVGWFIGGKIHSGRAVKKAKKDSSKVVSELYTKYLQDVGALQSQNAELQNYITSLTKQMLTEEFLSADLDNDRRVTRAEFEMHKKKYLAQHPEFQGQFPRFEEFDPDSNGMITLAEHENYYERQGLV